MIGKLCHVTFVRTGVFKYNNPAFLQVRPCLLREEQIRTLDDKLVMGFAFRIRQSSNIRDVDSFRAE